jgi:hypothetical protein
MEVAWAKAHKIGVINFNFLNFKERTMLKKVLLVALALLLVPAFCYAGSCPNYEFGFQGKTRSCVQGLWTNIPGSCVDLYNNGVKVGHAVTNAAGCYKVTKSCNACDGARRGTAIGYINESWSVTIALPYGYAGMTKTCEASKLFTCCCEGCTQCNVKCCDLDFKYCCNTRPPV